MPVRKVTRNSKKTFFGGTGVLIPYRRKKPSTIKEKVKDKGLAENSEKESSGQ